MTYKTWEEPRDSNPKLQLHNHVVSSTLLRKNLPNCNGITAKLVSADNQTQNFRLPNEANTGGYIERIDKRRAFDEMEECGVKEKNPKMARNRLR